MANTTNFNWETPDDTDLVKDGAAAIRTLGSSIDTSFVDLKGGTTGQVLSKASNTDLDYTWVTTDDANAIQNAIVDAKGDLIAASAADTPARLAVGNNGETLLADSSATTGLRWQPNFAAGKNKIINGDFGIWQRGTSFSPAENVGTFTADRFIFQRNGTGYTATCSRQTFTPGAAPVAGYEGQFFWRYNVTVAGASNTYAVLDQKIEDVRTLAGQTATISFYAKADTTRTVTLDATQDFGSGGSSQVGTVGGSFSVTTSWTRFSATISIPSISGKTIGTGSYLFIRFGFPVGVTETIDLWGVQVEAANTATAFQTATGTLQGELAACQRYYFRTTSGQSFAPYAVGSARSTTAADFVLKYPVTMRIAPASIDYGTVGVRPGNWGAGVIAAINVLLNTAGINTDEAAIYAEVASGLTTSQVSFLLANNSTTSFIGLSAEL